ncbi:DUF5610 domain-containing protein [Marinomonas ostreistagni]|uniref:DUF5610 domain-containing protein n=1 Tax=Marinomonas ostreistagni TaxID=359209 RepID=UPI0019500716|nr:DUF5610 domain-containing protein [Marinomonas ostreistagni]MBM6549671.1 DUF5610 domain-containing protein [Marinomonas ostreistagni]
MSDPLKGLGDLNTAFLPRRSPAENMLASPQGLQNRGVDGYSPGTSMSTRSLSVVQQSMSARLQASFATPNANAAEQAQTSASKNQNDFSPDKVAQRILSHIGNYMEKLQQEGADNERLSSVFDTAKSAVAQGMADASEKLEALGWLTTGVQQGIDDTQALIDDGFESLDKMFLQSAETVMQASMQTQQSYQREDYSQIQMTTQEGDVVSVNLYALQASAQGQAAAMDENGVSFVRYESSSQSFAFDFSVEGDLNDDERAAIQQMMQSVGQVSDLFYDGDVAGALQKGLDMGFDASQLASFSMSLSSTQTMRSSQAVSAYGQGAGSGMRSIQEPLADYREALEDTIQKASEIFTDFRDVVDSVMGNIMTMREEQEQKMDDMQQMFAYQREMIDRISQWLMPDAEQATNDSREVESNQTSNA